jgi:hypothetical protein
MFRSLLLSVTPALLAATAASAALVLNVEHVELAPSDLDRTVRLDVYLVDPDGLNESFNGFVVLLTGPANTEAGVRIVPPSALPSASHPYVLRHFPGYTPDDLRADYSSIFVSQMPQALPFFTDVSEGNDGLFSVSLLVPRGTPPGTYPLVVDPTGTTLSSGVTSFPWVIGPPGGVTVVPEPAAGSVVLLGFALLHRGRRPNAAPRLPCRS